MLEYSNRKRDWWGPSVNEQEGAISARPVCPTSLTFDNDRFTWDNGSCPIFDLGPHFTFTFDSTFHRLSGTAPTFDEERQ